MILFSLRGGSWFIGRFRFYRSTRRIRHTPGFAVSGIGFRLALPQ